jgi:hypothetical protein
MIERLGYTEPPRDSATTFMFDEDAKDYSRYAAAQDRLPRREDQPGAVRPTAFHFWYRQSPVPFRPITQRVFQSAGSVGPDDPPAVVPGMITVSLDPEGRLTEFQAVPPRYDESPPAPAEPDWPVLFEQAGLPYREFRPAAPRWNPPVYCERIAAWEGSYPGRPDIPLRIEAGAYRGRPVSFRMIGPWTHREPGGTFGSRPWLTAGDVVWLCVVLVCLIGGGAVAFRNVRRRRADVRGCARLVGLLAGLELVTHIVSAHHVPSLAIEVSYLLNFLGFCVFWPGVVGVSYLALEPYIRRRWPSRIISWTRLLAGRFRDPLVGRHVLIGGVVGVLLGSITAAQALAPAWFGLSLEADRIEWLRWTPSWAILISLDHAILKALNWMFIILLLTLAFRKEFLAWGIPIPLAMLWRMLGSQSGSSALFVNASFTGLWITLLLLTLQRFGILAMAVALSFMLLLERSPITLDASAWYAPRGAIALLILAAVATAGFVISLGGQRLFRDDFFGDA